ncbi:MAG: 5'-nucleotidase [Gammaproteobacteria bacterium]|jgi:5'-nucleotidase
MPERLDEQLVVALSSRTLFDLEESHRVFEQEGVEAYSRYQIEHENDVLEPGVAFALVRKLLRLNDDGRRRVEIILLSHNSADTGLRVFNSIEHYGLSITRAAFTNGASPYRYVEPFGADLFLSADPNDVVAALDAGYAAATLVPSRVQDSGTDEIRIAFDGDAVLFSDEAERIFKEQGLEAFAQSERTSAGVPLSGGPFKDFLAALHAIQADFPADASPIRTALVTARSAPAHERVIRTLRAWNIRIDEALFLGGMEKTAFLKAFGADVFFDDQQGHCELAAGSVATGHVPHGVANRRQGGR